MKKHFIFLAPVLFFLLLQEFDQSNNTLEIIFQEFKDNTGTKGATETREVFKTLAAYHKLFWT
jgi:hypothetical protein